MASIPQNQLKELQQQLSGEFYFDDMMRAIYATDASVYKELPLAVCYPKNKDDIRKLIDFARKHQTALIPRAAGTSLAGQCVGDGIVVDVSKHFTDILELNVEEAWVKVQPGVVRDELNRYLKPHGLLFGPNTSTANRAMIGGMVGNNSCGSYSIVYGTTRDHVVELETILSDGSEATFAALSPDELINKAATNNLEGEIYGFLLDSLSKNEVQKEIVEQFPKSGIHRRNTGYAIDELIKMQPFDAQGEPLNLCSLLTGSEGTLAFTTGIKIHLDPLPPKQSVLICPHFTSVKDCLKAVIIAMKYEPRACEMMDKIIMDCTKGHREYEQYRFFLEGDPAALLIVEFADESIELATQKAEQMRQDMEVAGLGYAYTMVVGDGIPKVWSLRSAGLGLLANIPGDKKAVAVIEDTAVQLDELPNYIEEFTAMMEGYGQQAVYYAHAGAGELHLRPILNLKEKSDRALFRAIGSDTADLVKKYGGSLSGEHGDGRVRAEFIPKMVGDKNYELFRSVKAKFDPYGIFNPGKIVNAPPMDESLRYEEGQATPEINTILDFSGTEGILRAAEKCNGSGDCRKLPGSGGSMCPSYMATRDEKDTTRARANVLREYLTNSTKTNKFDHEEIYQVMDLCLSCKGCLSECPSNVDMASLKAEFLYQYYKTNGVPLRARAIANITKLNSLGMKFRPMANFTLTNDFTSTILKKQLGVAPQRSLPELSKITLSRWLKKNGHLYAKGENGSVYLFIDEFTEYNDANIGITAVKLLSRLGYGVKWVKHHESGRTYISKGLLDEAKVMANRNVEVFKDRIDADIPLIGIEPSGILSFRDEYPRLVDERLKEAAKRIAPNCLMIDEFLANEMKKGKINSNAFHAVPKTIKLHGHCHQKALSKVDHTAWILSLPENYNVEVIPSGCCGMAGSFGYEEEHYEVSMKVGEMVLFPAVRKATPDTLIAAPGTSCRHQIKDGTDRKAMHPVEILYQALV
ncbi:MAG: FAD-linked oxidase C-terminal domain-containing protein [Chitinophagales bacterium]